LTVRPVYVLFGTWSEKNASAEGIASRTSAAAAVFCALSRKPRYDGTAIESRIPMMIRTTRSSIW
jgi:hypothetical protein